MRGSFGLDFYCFNRAFSCENFHTWRVIDGMKIFRLSSALLPFMPGGLIYFFKLLIPITHYGIYSWEKDDYKGKFY